MVSLTNLSDLTTKQSQISPLQLIHISAKDGIDIPVHTIGRGTPVLLLHAFGMDARQFLPFVLPLIKTHCFYLPHLRGFGLSADTPTTQFDFIEQYVDDVEDLLSHICKIHQVEAIDVAAISMGALVMWAYFNRYLQGNFKSSSKLTVKRYLNIDQSPTVHNLPDWQGGVFGGRQAEVFAQFKTVLDNVLPYLHADGDVDFTHLPYAVKLEIIQMEQAFSLLSVGRRHSRWLTTILQYQSPRKLAFYNHSTWRQKIRCLQAYLSLPYDYRNNLEYLDIPITMLIGGQSALYNPMWQRKIAATLPDAVTIEIYNSGHAIPMDTPIRFAQVLKDFLLSATN